MAMLTPIGPENRVRATTMAAMVRTVTGPGPDAVRLKVRLCPLGGHAERIVHVGA